MIGKIFRNRFLLLIVGLAFLFSCEKEKVILDTYGSISGIVLDGTNNLPVVTANVSTNPPSSAVLTNSQGKFIITQVPAGNVVITVKKENYSQGTMNVLVQRDKTTDVTILLDITDPNSGSGVVISNPSPANETTDIPQTVDLYWKLENTTSYDSIKFDVLLYESEDLVGKTVAKNLSDTTYTVELLDLETTYFWQVVAKYSDVELNRSPVWSFSTIPFPELPYFYAMEKNGSLEIFNSDSTINDTTSPLLQLTSNTAYTNWLPMVNPSQTLVSFISNRLVDPYIYTIKRDGSEETRVLGFPVIGYNNLGEGYCWSPNGQFVVYGYYDKLKRTDIYSYATADIATAPAGRHFRQCDWNGHTNKIVVQTMGEKIYDSEIYMMNADGTGMEMIVDNLPGRIENPALSIDGDKVLFSHDVSGFNDPAGRQLDAHIFIMSIDSTEIIDVSFNKPDGTNDIFPRFSPNGAYVICNNVDNTGTGLWNIVIMDISGINRITVVEDAKMPYWN